jgi:hypothetical protein
MGGKEEEAKTCATGSNCRSSNDSDVRNQTDPGSQCSDDDPAHRHGRHLHADGEVVVHGVVLLELLLCTALLVTVAHHLRLDDLLAHRETASLRLHSSPA